MFLPRTHARALAIVALLFATAAGAFARVALADNPLEPGTIIENRAEAVYEDGLGQAFRTVSPTVSVTVKAVSGLVVTPDETQASATVVANERVVRVFRICNTGNTPDLYTITRADISAPSSIVSLHFDTDASGTFGDDDRLIQLDATLSPRLARGECAGVLATIDTNAVEPGSRLTISITARSSVPDTANGSVEDAGTIINAVGNGARFGSPNDARLPPLKTVEGRERVVAARGQTLNYRIAFRNHGDVAARSVVMRDELPEGLEYIAGTLRVGNKNLTDASDADEGSYTNRRIEVRLAEVKTGELVEVGFQAHVAQTVAAGAGVVNAATITAENASPSLTTEAIAVVNPFGLVYEGRSGGASAIAGARVALLSDATSGATATLSSNGSEPNTENANPFSTDAQGRWSFALSPTQLATPGAGGARYFLNVTAQGFRARMIEALVEPAGAANNLFSLTLRALDGQPLARAGAFDLTTDAVTIPNLAAFALNVPMFETTAVEIQKASDRPSAEVGEVVTYRVEVHNATDSALEETEIRDTLPGSFHYAEGSARAEVPPTGLRSIEPEQLAGGLLLFKLGTLPAGARATLSYRVRIGANAREGEQINSAIAQGRFVLTGERVVTEAARAAVRVRRGVFSTQQIILGRVFEDANRNGMFDDGERAMAGVRLYLNNGQSVLTDSVGQYNFPTVGEGSHVIALDPVTLPAGYALSDSARRDQKSWTRLLRTPLGGGSLLRQNFALTPPPDADNEDLSASARPQSATSFAQSNRARVATQSEAETSANSVETDEKRASEAKLSSSAKERLASGVYEVEATETVAPVAAGKVEIVSPKPNAVVTSAALEVDARVAAGWSVAVEVNGERVPDAKIGERRADHKNRIASFSFIGIGMQPGPNKIRVTAIAEDGSKGETSEVTAYGRGPAKRLEIVPSKTELSAGGRDRAMLRVRALDAWGNPAADGAVALEVSAGRLLRAIRVDAREEKTEKRSVEAGAKLKAANVDESGAVANDAVNEKQQVIALAGGEGFVELVADASPGAVEIRATTGAIAAESRVRVTPEARPSILVGLAEVSIGGAAPEISMHDSEETARTRLAFFYRGQMFGKNLLTLAYDSQRPINRTSGNDRFFQLDPLERAYPLFGDSSTRYEDAQSNSKLYARLDRGRSFLMFGDFETENREAGLASYSRRLTGVKLHVENSKGDFVSVTGARPDTAFARDVFDGGALGFQRLSHADVLAGSEVVTIEVRDRRNPEVIISREPLVRSVDYNLNASTGEIFFLRPVSAFDYQLNLVQVVVSYEHRAEGMSSAVYTARVVKNFESLGLKLGLSAVEQKQSEFGSFFIGGVDAEKKLPEGGRVRAEWATSRGRAAFSGNLFSTSGEDNNRHDGNALRVELEQPLPFKEARLRASFLRADQNFMNPFGATVTPGSRRMDVSVDMRVRKTSTLHLGVTDERNKTENVDNSRLTASVQWTENIGDDLRASVGYDARRYQDNAAGRETNSNLLTLGAEWQATDKLQLSVKREQNLSEADPTYPNQTTLAANYQYNQFTRLFFTQRLASAPITPIGDFSATGFAISGARRETAVGVETRLGKYASLNSRYQLENGVSGADSFAVIGLQNRFQLNKELSLDLGYERGFHLAGAGESFNNIHFGMGWQPNENFRSSARYEMRDRGGMGSALTLGAAGRIGDNVTTLARFQISRASFSGRGNSSLNAQAALAWRPLNTDAAGMLFSYTRRQTRQDGAEGAAGMFERADVLSSDGYYQVSRDVEVYGRFALRFGDNGNADVVRVSSLAYLAQARVVYRLGRYFDAAAETRMLFAPSSHTRRNSYGAELGYWVLPDLRLGGGYNWTAAQEPAHAGFVAGRRGFYFTVSSKLSKLFDLFGSSHNEKDADAQTGTQADDDATQAKQKPE